MSSDVLEFYGLREQPFGVTPDSSYLFLSETHREALASVLYGIESGCGFVALIAKPGLGKTTLLFHTLGVLQDKAATVFLFQAASTPLDLLRALLADLGSVQPGQTLDELQARLRDILTEQSRAGKRVVVIIDEAQNLDNSVLELVRSLSNFETPRQKLIQIILCGQQQLAEKLSSPGLQQLKQRISIVACLQPLSARDIPLYIEHRLRIADYSFDRPLYTEEALALIVQHSEGVPRNVNNLCFNSLALGFALRQRTMGAEVVHEVIADLDLDRWRKPAAIFTLPKASAQQEAPAPANEDGPSQSLKRITRSALVLAMLLATAALALRYRATVPEAAVPRMSPPVAVSGGTPSAATRLPLPHNEISENHGVPSSRLAPARMLKRGGQDFVKMDPHTAVRVLAGRTLLGICLENFGACDAKRLQEIKKLNPRLTDLNHVKTGQTIHLPAAATSIQARATLSDGSYPVEDRNLQ